MAYPTATLSKNIKNLLKTSLVFSKGRRLVTLYGAPDCISWVPISPSPSIHHIEDGLLTHVGNVAHKQCFGVNAPQGVSKVRFSFFGWYWNCGVGPNGISSSPCNHLQPIVFTQSYTLSERELVSQEDPLWSTCQSSTSAKISTLAPVIWPNALGVFLFFLGLFYVWGDARLAPQTFPKDLVEVFNTFTQHWVDR